MAAATDKKEQEMKEEIGVYMRKRDYYDLLGIEKTASEADIKKAYKKLALRFHPDKNNTNGSKEVFNKVTNAYANLIDPEKRASYDRFGPEEEREARYRPQRAQRQGYNQEQEFEDIFQGLFGGGMGGRYQANHYQHFTFNMGGQRGQNQNGGFNMMYFFFFVILIYVVPFFFGKEQPLYSSNPSSTYRFPTKTSIINAPFYVKQQYFNLKDPQAKKEIEVAVDSEYLMKMKKECDMLQWSRAASGSAQREKYQRSCQRLRELQAEYPQYIRYLFYGY